MARLPSIKPQPFFATCLGAAVLTGCYSSDQLVEKFRNNAIRTRIDEVELGSFRVTLPRNEETGAMTEIDVRVFGESERYKINEIEAELEAHAPQLEDHLIKTLRLTTQKEMAEPNLNRLRQRLLNAMNEQLTDAPLVGLGFYDVRFVRH